MGLGGAGDGFGGLSAEVAGAIEAEQLALPAAGFDDAVREQGHLSAEGQGEDGLVVNRIRAQPERQPVFERYLLAVDVGRQVTGVGGGEGAIGATRRTRQVVNPPEFRPIILWFMAERILPGDWV